jgi:hypothetical protein
LPFFALRLVTWAASRRTERDHKEVLVRESERQKKSYTTEQKFLTIDPNFRHYVRLADQELGKIFRAESLENETGIAGRR